MIRPPSPATWPGRTFADAVARGIDIVAFPEVNLSGYIDPGQHPEAVLSLAGPEVEQLLDVTRGRGTALLAGLVEANRHVFAECARQGAQIVFEVAAPGLYGEQATGDWRSGFEWWEGECRSHLSRYAADHGFWIAVATQAGRTVDEGFPGGGYLFAPGGQRLHATPDGSPGAVYLKIDLEAHRVRARP